MERGGGGKGKKQSECCSLCWRRRNDNGAWQQHVMKITGSMYNANTLFLLWNKHSGVAKTKDAPSKLSRAMVAFSLLPFLNWKYAGTALWSSRVHIWTSVLWSTYFPPLLLPQGKCIVGCPKSVQVTYDAYYKKCKYTSRKYWLFLPGCELWIRTALGWRLMTLHRRERNEGLRRLYFDSGCLPLCGPVTERS